MSHLLEVSHLPDWRTNMTAIAANNTPFQPEDMEDTGGMEDMITVPGEPRPLKEIIADVQATNEPRLLTLGGEPQMVCLSVAAYRTMEAKTDYWETVQAIREAQAEYDRGEGRDAREAFEELRRKLGVPR